MKIHLLTKKNKKNINGNHNNGFTLLMATLISSLVLSLGISIFNIVIKELTLSSYGRDSQFAFYAADTGAECALFWDIKERAFATSSVSTIECNGQTIQGVGGSGNSTFTLNFPPETYCAVVDVIKNDGNTTVESRGYNTCESSSPRRVERGIRITY